VLLRRSSCKSSAGSDQSSKGGNAGTSHERKTKGGKIVVAAAAASSSTPTASGKQTQKGVGSSGGGSWKGRKSGWEARFLFKEPEAGGGADTQATPASEMDTRTTVMIRNIPNKYRYPCQSPRLLQQCYISWATHRIAILLADARGVWVAARSCCSTCWTTTASNPTSGSWRAARSSPSPPTISSTSP
jgi:hypothetical protein